jgi:hypothetical protein
VSRYDNDSYWTVEYDCDGYECAAKIEITYRNTSLIMGMSKAARNRLDDALLEKAMLAIGWLKRGKEFFCGDCNKEGRIPK